MAVHATNFNVRTRGCTQQHLPRQLNGDTEFVLLLAGGDVRMAAGINVQVDAQQNPPRCSQTSGNLVNDGNFLLGLDGKSVDAPCKCLLHLIIPLSDPAERDDPGLEPCMKGKSEFSTRSDIRAKTLSL